MPTFRIRPLRLNPDTTRALAEAMTRRPRLNPELVAALQQALRSYPPRNS